MGTLVDRVHRVLSDEDLETITGTYHDWRNAEGNYEDKEGWWKSTTLEEIKKHGYVLTPGRYVGAEEVEDDGVSFEDKMQRLTSMLFEQFAESSKLEAAIRSNLKGLGF